MKIALINNLYGKYRRGGAEAIVATLEKSLKNQGHEVIIISTRPSLTCFATTRHMGNEYYLPSFYYHLNHVPTLLRVLWHIYKFIDPFTLYRLKKIIKKEKVEMVLSHNMMGFNWWSSWIIRLLNIKQAHYLHDIQLLHPSGRLLWSKESKLESPLAKTYQALQRLMTQPIKYIISPSEWLLQLHRDKGFFRLTKTLPIFNPIDHPSQVKVTRQKIFTFLYLGQIDEAKGVDLLIRAFLEIKKLNNCQLIIAGNGNSLKKLQQKYQNESVNFLGKVASSQIPQLMKSSHCLVLPSLIYENLPTSLLLAVNYQLPTIASNLGGSKEISKQFGGRLFSPGNIDDLVSQMKKSLQNPSQTKTKGLDSLWSENYLKKIFDFLHSS